MIYRPKDTDKECAAGESVPGRIAAFIRKHHVMTLATCTGNVAWCSNVFYSYIPRRNVFVFTSDHKTRHGREALANPVVSGSISLETRIVGKIRGLQLSGIMEPVGDATDPEVRKAYLLRFPYAAVADLDLWTLRPTYMKLTDNTLGFGKKLIWEDDRR